VFNPVVVPAVNSVAVLDTAIGLSVISLATLIAAVVVAMFFYFKSL
jgi:hypothetical protein